MATTATTSRSAAAARPDGITASITNAAATTMSAKKNGRISVFQCGRSRNTGSSPSVSDELNAIPHILACPPTWRSERKGRGAAKQYHLLVEWVRLGARRHWVFGVVLVGAIAVRVLVMLAFRPIMWFGGDSASYLATGLRLVPDPSRVGGYGFFLWLLRPLHSFAVVAAVQHVMGLAIGWLSYLLARRYGLPAWAATLAAVPVLFDGYELQLEGDVVPDVPFGCLIFVALYLLLRSPAGRRPRRTGPAAFFVGAQ